MIVVALAVAVAYGLVLQLPHRRLIAPGIAAAGVHPALGIVYAASHFGVVHARRIHSMRLKSALDRADELTAIDLVASGVEAGVSFPIAVSTASRFVRPHVSEDLGRHLRRANRNTPIDPETDPTPIEVMFRIARLSASSGARLGTELRGLSDTERERDNARHDERLARLPVKMLFPLALLILPGFLLVAVVPAVVGGVSKLTL